MSNRKTTMIVDRRSLIKRLLIIGGMPMLCAASRNGRARGNATPVRPPATDLDNAFRAEAGAMKRLAVAAGDQPYGAVLAKGTEIVGKGPSRVVTNKDPTAHAEMEAIRDAARRLDTRDLTGCVMYSTSEPCRMCETAAYWANVSRMRYSAEIVDGGAPSYSSC